MKPFKMIAVVIFALICIAHLVRAITAAEIRIGGIVTPVWISRPAAVVAGLLAFLLWHEKSQ
jgi:hypothetical protein